MKLFRLFPLLGAVQAFADVAPNSFPDMQSRLRDDFAAKLRTVQESKSTVLVEPNGWLFFAPELKLLSAGKFWGNDARLVAPARKPDEADPGAAIIDFNNQLKQRGIDLLLVPVPPKAAIYVEQILPQFDLKDADPAPYLTSFYDELRRNGVRILDLAPIFLKRRDGERGFVFCKTDTHWSGNGCVLAAEAIAAAIRSTLNLPAIRANQDYVATWNQVQFTGDLANLLAPGVPKPGPEAILARTIHKSDGTTVQPDINSPLLVLGDSHTLVYHDFDAQGAGLIDQLADELGFAPDLIGTRGSGATTVRVDLYRRSHRDPRYLSQKKVVVWCFSAREFTEASGWPIIAFPK